MTIPDSYGGKTANISPFVSHPKLKINLEHQNDRKYPKDKFSNLKLQPLNFLGPSHFIPKRYGEKRPAFPLLQSPKIDDLKIQDDRQFPKEKSLPIENRNASNIVRPTMTIPTCYGKNGQHFPLLWSPKMTTNLKHQSDSKLLKKQSLPIKNATPQEFRNQVQLSQEAMGKNGQHFPPFYYHPMLTINLKLRNDRTFLKIATAKTFWAQVMLSQKSKRKKGQHVPLLSSPKIDDRS